MVSRFESPIMDLRVEFHHWEPSCCLEFTEPSPHIEEGSRQKRRESSLLFWGWCTWMPHSPFTGEDDLNRSFWENIHFGSVGVWYGVSRMSIHFGSMGVWYGVSRMSIHFYKASIRFYFVFATDLKPQRRPLPSLLSGSYF